MKKLATILAFVAIMAAWGYYMKKQGRKEMYAEWVNSWKAGYAVVIDNVVVPSPYAGNKILKTRDKQADGSFEKSCNICHVYSQQG